MIDPFTMSLLAAQGIAGAAKTGYGLYQQNAGRNSLAGVQEASRMKPSEYAEMLREAKSGKAVQARIDAVNKSMATSTDALSQGGSRALIGGIGRVTDAGISAKNQLLDRQQQDIMRALSGSAMGSERQIQRDTQRELMERKISQDAVNAGVQNTVSGLSDIGRTIGYGAGLRGEDDSTDPLKDLSNANRSTREAQKSLEDDVDKAVKIDFGTGSAQPNVKEMRKLMEGFTGNLNTEGMQEIDEELEEDEVYNNGGAIQTPGEFNHNSNPIQMIQDGEIIGEMTGGEYVLNPEQADKIAKQSKFFRNLLNTKRFK
tara:strand:+ start:3216 stop:4160 length:945 start_codon:yes stop_codon:yes gene_type:complete